MTTQNEFPKTLQGELQPAWNAYVDFLAPMRPELHRYCLRLTHNLWDAEDLVQDTVVRVFAQLGARWDSIAAPRRYLARTATNLWIDRIRRREREHALLSAEASTPPDDAPPPGERDVRDAAGELLQRLAPKERAAVLLKDVFDFSLEETAELLHTTIGAVKSALHRGRERLDASTEPNLKFAAPPREILDRFTAAFNARDLDTLSEIVADDATVELVGGNVMHGRDDNAGFFQHALMPYPGDDRSPRFELVDYEGEPIVVGFRFWKGVEGVNDISRLEVRDDGRIACIRCYCWCPDTLGVLANALGKPVNPRPYRSPTIEEFQEIFELG